MGWLHGYKCSSASLSHKSCVTDLQSYDPIVQKIYGRLRPISYSCDLLSFAYTFMCVLSWSQPREQRQFHCCSVIHWRWQFQESELDALRSLCIFCTGKVGQPIYQIKSKASPCIMDVLLTVLGSECTHVVPCRTPPARSLLALLYFKLELTFVYRFPGNRAPFFFVQRVCIRTYVTIAMMSGNIVEQ